MSEPAAERPTRGTPPSPGGPAAGGGNILQRKIGPLPGWAWAGLAGVGALAWWYFRNRSGQSAADAASGASGEDVNAAVGDDIQGQLATIQTEIQNLQQSESQEDESTPANSGSSASGGTKAPAIRHVSTGKETLNQIAKSRHTSVAHIVSVSRAGPENKENLAKLVAWAKHPGTRRKGIVYYTSKGPVEGATA